MAARIASAYTRCCPFSLERFHTSGQVRLAPAEHLLPPFRFFRKESLQEGSVAQNCIFPLQRYVPFRFANSSRLLLICEARGWSCAVSNFTKNEVTVYRGLIDLVENLWILKAGVDVSVALPASSVPLDNLFDSPSHSRSPPKTLAKRPLAGTDYSARSLEVLQAQVPDKRIMKGRPPSGVGFDRLINAYNQEHPHE